jgi:SSS family solute:Na+ symporter
VNYHLALLIGYAVALTAIGLWVARLVKGSSDFFVAGRALSAPLLFSTVLAANIGAGSTVGAAGLAYSDGISAWWWNGSAAIGSLALALWVGPRIWALASSRGFYTAGDFLEYRYGRPVRGVVASLIWVGTLAILAGQLIAGAAVLEVVAAIPRAWGTAIGAAAMLVYFVAGGLLSSAWVNAVQLVVLIGGLVGALPVVLAHVGGIAGIAARAPSHFWEFGYSTGPGSGFTLLAMLGPAFIISPGLLQKVYGASDARAVRLGVGVQALCLGLFAFVPVLMGMAARAAYPDIASPNLVLPRVLVDALPVWLGALALAAVFSAEVSTCDAILFMLATSLSQDLYRQFVNPRADDRTILRVARLAAVAGGALGVVLAIQLPTVISALSIFYTLLGVSLFVPVVAGLYVRAAGTPEAVAAIVAGVSFVLAVQLSGREGQAVWTNPNVGGLTAAGVACVVVLVLRKVRSSEVGGRRSEVEDPASGDRLDVRGPASVFVLARALTYATLFIGLVLVFLPARALSAAGIGTPPAIGTWQVAGAIVGTAGAALALSCVLTFAFVGKGTPAPFDPPRRLVVRGPYRFVRNPMYIGAGLALTGAALFYQTLALFAYAGAFLLITHLFVVFYEEPTLRRMFGEEYEAYCRTTKRWWPSTMNKKG